MAYKEMKEDVKEALRDSNAVMVKMKRWLTDPGIKDRLAKLEKDAAVVKASDLIPYIHKIYDRFDKIYDNLNFLIDHFSKMQDHHSRMLDRQIKVYDSTRLIYGRIERLEKKVKGITKRKPKDQIIGFK